jgi:hypothetical protein
MISLYAPQNGLPSQKAFLGSGYLLCGNSDCSSRFMNRLLSLFIFIAAAVLTFFICFQIETLPYVFAARPLVLVWLRIILTCFGGGLILIFFLPLNEHLKLDLAIAVLSLFLTTVICWSFKNTPYPLNGTWEDQAYQIASVTKFACYPGSVDFIYKDLPAFYPPLYFFILGKVAFLLDMEEPWRIVKYGVMGTAFLAPFVSQKLWIPLVGRFVATGIAFMTLTSIDLYKPYEWISLVMFVPWWLYFVEGFTRNEKPKNILWFVTGGIIGAIIFQTYYYWFFAGGISLLLGIIFPSTSGYGPGEKLAVHRLWEKMQMLFLTALFSSPYWLPYIFSMIAHNSWEFLQNRWFQEYQILLPYFATLENLDIYGILLTIGLGYLLLTFQTNRISALLLNLVVATFIWFLLNYVLIIADSPVLATKIRALTNYVLEIGAAIALVRLWKEKIYSRSCPDCKPVIIAFMFILTMFFGQKMADLPKNDMLTKALETDYPSVVAQIPQVTEKYQNKVFLTPANVLFVYLPVYGFIPWNAHYSHPAGQFSQRVGFLENLSHTKQPEAFAAQLMNNEFVKIDYILLKNDMVYSYAADNFPDGVEIRYIQFERTQFDSQYFESIQLAEDFLLFVPRYENNPSTDSGVP